MSNGDFVPFNDLSRIHRPLLGQFQEALTSLVETSSLVLGQQVASFEDELAKAEGTKYAIGVNSGTSAIELALRALGVGVGDEVITTAFTFVATCFAILESGATPVLIDIDRQSGLMDPSGIEAAITPKTKAVILVTLHGRVENLEQIREICASHNILFIIDAAQSHLGTFKGRHQSEFCDVATLSFYPGKNLGALGEAGAILTNSAEIKERLLLMRDWGAREKYNHEVWGGNYRLEPLQASFLEIKLRGLLDWTAQRQKIASIYRENISPEVLTSPIHHDGSHVFHIFSVNVKDRKAFCDHLTQNRIGFGFHYPRAIHQQPAYTDHVLKPVKLEHAEWLADATVSLPIFPGQTDSEIHRVIDIVNQA